MMIPYYYVAQIYLKETVKFTYFKQLKMKDLLTQNNKPYNPHFEGLKVRLVFKKSV